MTPPAGRRLLDTSPRPIDACLGYRFGQPCSGRLEAVGEGARAENARLARQREAVS